MAKRIHSKKIFEILSGEYGPYIGTVTANDEYDKPRSYTKQQTIITYWLDMVL